MRFIVYGAGAVGGVVGARLIEHGHDVVMIARGDHADAIAADGLIIKSLADETTVRPTLVRHPDEIAFEPRDVVLLATKSNDTVGALDALRAAAPHVSVCSLQNGVLNERAALRRFAHVQGVCVMLPTAHLTPGVVEAFSTPVTGLLDVGRYPDGVDDTTEAVVEAFAASTFSAFGRPDIMRWKYRKLLLNVNNAVQATCGFEGSGAELARLITDEAATVFDAAGIAVASAEEDAERRGSIMSGKPTGGERTGGGSSWQSLHRQTGSIETDYLNGEIVLLGRLHGVPTPVNELIQQVAAQMASERSAPGSADADALLGRLSSDL
jgi:2-dehydropantoate 2-reductase